MIGVGTFLGPMSGSIVNVALPEIARSYSVDVQSVEVGRAQLPDGQPSLLPFTGKLGLRFGEARVYTAGFISYGIGSALCALAAHSTIGVLVAARSLEAAGSALLFGVGSAIVTRYVPPARRGLAFGLFGSIVGIALISGPVVGGLMAESLGWPLDLLGARADERGRTNRRAADPARRARHAADLPALSSVLWVVAVASATMLGETFNKGLGSSTCR